jgi:hypothetical protein
MYRRRHRHNLDSVTIGRYAGEESNTENTVSVGRKAGYSQQKQWAIAIGDRAGEETQDLNAIAIGILAGQTSQSTLAIAIGNQAGRTTQGAKAIAIGGNAGQSTQSTLAIAIGDHAGEKTQGAGAIAIGENAGQTSQGANAIAIGNKAGMASQPESSIIISTSDTEITATKKGLYIDPIRKFDDREARPATVKEGNILSYNYKNDTADATKEVVTGFPRLPSYPTDAEVASAFTAAGGTLDQTAAGSMYFDSTKKKIKVYDGAKWTALADEEDIKKAMASLAAAAGAGSKGSYVTGSGQGDPQGGFTSVGGSGAYAPVLYMPDGSKAREGFDYYLEYVPGYGSIGPPVFYKDISVVNVETPGEGRPGFKTTTYDNGHVINETIPVEQWNPPLAAWNNLPTDERRAITQEYAEARGYDVMLGGDSGRVDAPNTFESDAFRSYLESKGLG